MSDFQKQLVLLALDKGLLGAIIGILAFLAKRYLDQRSAQLIYKQKLAEEQVCAYKEISRIVTEQIMLMGRIANSVPKVCDAEEHKKKTAEAFAKIYNTLGDHYKTEMPKIHAQMIFVSSEVADHLIKYITVFGQFMELPWSIIEDRKLDAPEKGVLAVAAELLHALTNEIHNLKI